FSILNSILFTFHVWFYKDSIWEPYIYSKRQRPLAKPGLDAAKRDQHRARRKKKNIIYSMLQNKQMLKSALCRLFPAVQILKRNPLNLVPITSSVCQPNSVTGDVDTLLKVFFVSTEQCVALHGSVSGGACCDMLLSEAYSNVPYSTNVVCSDACSLPSLAGLIFHESRRFSAFFRQKLINNELRNRHSSNSVTFIA
ncbi:hypothetical protein L9F63_025161, partial [Diploptera punctata]